MLHVIYFLIAILATTAGAIAGISGGIVIRPLLDIMNHFDAQTISVLSSITVLSMSVVSAGKQLMQKAPLNYKVVIPLAIGASLGGVIGQRLLATIVAAFEIGRIVTMIQNSLLLAISIAVFLYIRNRDKIKSLNMSNMLLIVLTGVFLGMIAAFLGIGGGPINVAMLILLFSFDIKTAAVGSIVIILFSQTANVIRVGTTIGFSAFDLRMLPPMIIGAMSGGFIGASLNKKLSLKVIESCFFVMLALVAAFAIFNITRGLI